MKDVRNIFERGSELKLRFNTPNGVLVVENLWDLKLSTGKVNLNTIAKQISKEIKEFGEEDFVGSGSNIPEELTLSMEIVKHIIQVKKDRAAKAELGKANESKNALIDELIAKKELEELGNLSKEELLKLKSQ
jgi:hypothetical protein